MIDWAVNHWVELIGTISGLIYIYFEIKAKIAMWPIGILTSAFYILVFYNSKFYADMSLQVYYLIISIYGWIYWSRGNKKDNARDLPIININKKMIILLASITLILFVIIAIILKQYTDSPLPYWDSFTTALSITATWMLAKKIIEQWLVWILVDIVSMGLYIYKDLFPTAILYFVFTILAFIGYVKWKQKLNQNIKLND